VHAARDLVNVVLSVVERPLFGLLRTRQALHPTVFIVGAPRSGTTLLYQALVSRYRFGYFDNLSGRLYRAPCLGLYLSRLARAGRGFASSFRSSYGSTRGVFEPNEAALFWRRWFPNEAHSISWEQAASLDLTYMRDVIRTVTRLADAPFLFKRVYNSIRISALSRALPEALFLVCHRDGLEIARSMLNSRKDAGSDLNLWWGLKPRRYADFKDSPWPEQIAAQIYDIYAQLAEDQRRLGHHRFYHVDYADLCDNPRKVVDGVGRFLKKHGCVLEGRGTLPPQFPKSAGGRTSPEEDRLLIEALAVLADECRPAFDGQRYRQILPRPHRLPSTAPGHRPVEDRPHANL
jgi:hypothetical protein